MRTNYGICIRVWVYRPMLRYICYYSTLMAAFLQAKKHRNTPQARLRPTSPALRATSPCRGGFGIPQSFPSSPEAPLPGATATTAASGGNREELLGPRPAGCERQRSRRWEPQPGQWHRASDDGEVGLRQSLSFVGKSGSLHRFLYLFVEVYGILILHPVPAH